MKLAWTIAFAVGLAGCATTTPAERMVMYETKCDSYGFEKGSDAYSQCLMQMDLEYKHEVEASIADTAQGLRDTGAKWSAMNEGSCHNRPSAYACGGY